MTRNREARAMGAAQTVQVDGATFKLRPIMVRHLCDLQMNCLDYYKDQQIKTLRKAADLLPSDELVKRVDRVTDMGLHNLPQVEAFDVSRVPLTKALLEWLKEQYGEAADNDVGNRALVANSLDSGVLGSDQVKKMTGASPVKYKIPYDQWWVTAVLEGRVQFVLTSIRYDHPDVSAEQIYQWPIAKLAEAARKVEVTTSADLGNT